MVRDHTSILRSPPAEQAEEQISLCSLLRILGEVGRSTGPGYQSHAGCGSTETEQLFVDHIRCKGDVHCLSN